MFSIALICTCHNRFKLTKNSFNTISKVLKNTKKVNKFHFFILDDNSKDETNDFLLNYENTSVLMGDGNLYWCGGMIKGWNYVKNLYFDLLFVFLGR